jgi:hypothetical protein
MMLATSLRIGECAAISVGRRPDAEASAFAAASFASRAGLLVNEYESNKLTPGVTSAVASRCSGGA